MRRFRESSREALARIQQVAWEAAEQADEQRYSHEIVTLSKLLPDLRHPSWSVSRRELLAAAMLGTPPLVAAARLSEQSSKAGENMLFIQLGDADIPGDVEEIQTSGWGRPGIGAARYVAVPRGAGESLSSRTSVTTRNGRTFVLKPGPELHVDQLGARGDGRHVDRQAIQAALDLLPRVGGTLRFRRGANYFLGSSRDGDAILIADRLTNCLIDGNGSTLSVATDARRPLTFVWRFYRFSNVEMRRFVGLDTNADLNREWQGQYFCTLDGSRGPCRGFTFDDITVRNGVAMMWVSGGGGGRVSDVVIRRSTADRCYYGAVFEENGDRVSAEFTASNCRRAYFPYGVFDHQIRIECVHDGSSPGADACCLIKRYAGDTGRISLELVLRGPRAPWSSAVKLEHQPPLGESGFIGDIDLKLRYEFADGDQPVPLTLSSYSSDGREERQVTANRWGDITVMGDFLSPPAALVVARVRPRVPGRLNLSQSARGLPVQADGFDVRN
jgi:hypothetical protein